MASNFGGKLPNLSLREISNLLKLTFSGDSGQTLGNFYKLGEISTVLST